MSKQRRDFYVSAAQVARAYGYTLKEALDLTQAERELLLLVNMSEEDRYWSRLNGILGTSWDVEDLMPGGGTKTEANKSRVGISLFQAIAPENFSAFAKAHGRNKSKSSQDTLSNEDTRKLFKSIAVKP